MAKNPECPAAINIKGEHFACESKCRSHPGLAHSNAAAEAIWTDDVQVLSDAWANAEEAGR